MKISHISTILALHFTALTAVTAEDAASPSEKAPPARALALALLAEDKHPSIGLVELKGDEPALIFLPIIHDGPLNHVSSTDLGDVRTILGNSARISDHLFEKYGVGNVLLEGVSKKVADHYNKPETEWHKISWGETNMITYDTWGEILRGHRWHLVPAFDVKPIGPLTLLGREYSSRIHGALKNAKEQGWFRTRQTFMDNQAEFMETINTACEGYNEKFADILKQDPGLKREYEITVDKRNKIFLDNLAAAEGSGVLLCGAGHYQDLAAQLEERGTSYAVVVPAGMQWPPTKKDEATIFEDMKKLGCQLKEVSLGFGDGGSAKITLPID